MRMAMIQTDAAEGGAEKNIAKTFPLMERAARSADFLMLPELWTIGCDFHHLDTEAVSLSDGLIEKLSGFARHHGVTLAAGTLPLKTESGIRNTLLLFSPKGDIIGSYSKRKLFRRYLEGSLMTAGDVSMSADIGGIKTGAAICYELYFPKYFRHMAKNGTTLVLVPASWPLLHIEKWEILARARAIENGIYLCAVNMAGTYHGIRLGGHSLFVDPEGNILAEAGMGEEIIYAEYEETKYKDLGKQLAVIRDVRSETKKI